MSNYSFRANERQVSQNALRSAQYLGIMATKEGENSIHKFSAVSVGGGGGVSGGGVGWGLCVSVTVLISY